MGTEPFKFAGHKVAGDDTLGLTVHDDKVKHLVTGIAGHGSGCNLAVKGGIGSKEELLSGLSAGIESTAYLDTAERTVGKISAIFTGKGNTLGDTLVDDGRTYFCQTVNIGFTAAIVSSLDGIIEKTIHGIIVVLVILGSVYTSLSCN